MFLKRIELQGFKSFASKTVLDFTEGITAIVGPNGSGKSNITDAVRWILGERESKNLRGAKSDDLIFAGTEKRARLGFAQASIYFDNSAGFFPVEYKEVVITRRIDRDGDSKFLLNQSEVRLKDIIDFFARGRLGARGLNIISQGESDTFLRASPAERRILIEEMLGLKEYLLKKHSSERELRNTRANLDKAMAMIEEMKPHIKMLRRQVGRYIERDKISAELAQAENIFYGTKVQEIARELSLFDPKIILTQESILEKKQELSVLEKNLKDIELSEPEAKKKIEEIRVLRRKLFNDRIAFASIANPPQPERAQFIHQDKKTPTTVINEIKILALSAIKKTSQEELQEALHKIVVLIDELEKKSVASPVVIEKEKISIDPEVFAKTEALNQALDELDAVEKQFTAEIDNFNQVFRSAIKAIDNKKNEIDELQDEEARIIFEKEKIKYREEELERQLIAMGRSLDEFSECSVELKDETTDLLSLERRIYRLRNEIASIGEVDESIIKESKEAEERYEFISRQIIELEKASSDLKTLIKELDYKIHNEFYSALENINKELSDFAKLIFGGGKIALKLEKIIAPIAAEESLSGGNLMEEGLKQNTVTASALEDNDVRQGIEIEVVLPKKRIKGLEALSGGERCLLSITILFGLISISPPPFIVLDEVDAALDEQNAKRFGEMLRRFASKAQFIVVTHNRVTMESADTLYGITLSEDGSSKLLSLQLS